MKIIENKEAKQIIASYPENISKKLMELRQLIFSVAQDMKSNALLEESIKWGEPSYITKNGSTIRIDWKASKPDQYAMYFNCKTILIETVKEIYAETFQYEGKRAIVFKLDKNIPSSELRHCISLALNYHKLKHLPLLGA